jgi:hypothetical protein
MSRVSGPDRQLQVMRLIARDGDSCVWCSTQLPLEKITLDHVVPYSQGGSNHLGNLLLACGSCNSKRGHRSVELTIEHFGNGKRVMRLHILRAAVERAADCPKQSRKKRKSKSARKRAASAALLACS